MLLLDFMSYGTASSYIDFINTLSWFRMYCVGRFGKNKADYLNGFETLENDYKNLWWDEEEQKNFSKYSQNTVEIMLDKVRKFLSGKRVDVEFSSSDLRENW